MCYNEYSMMTYTIYILLMLENMLNDTTKHHNISVLLVLIIEILHKYAYLSIKLFITVQV